MCHMYYVYTIEKRELSEQTIYNMSFSAKTSYRLLYLKAIKYMMAAIFFTNIWRKIFVMIS